MTGLVRSNHHLVFLPYSKLKFELHLSLTDCISTGNHSPTRNSSSRHNELFYQPAFIKVSSGNWKLFLQGWMVFCCDLKHSSSQTISLNPTVNKELFLALLKYADKLLAMKSLRVRVKNTLD